MILYIEVYVPVHRTPKKTRAKLGDPPAHKGIKQTGPRIIMK